MRGTIRTVLMAVLALAPAAPAAAQGPAVDVLGLGLEDLLNVEVVSSASKFPQEVREAPASITVVTAQDIRRYGHRTLADVLRSIRGLYTTNDRNYTYIGLRGFARPGDYNTRVLLLVDGHRMNDAIYDMAPIGTDFPIDVSLIDRVEVIRGPASSLYGTNAFFAVVNVVTRTGTQHSGVRVEAEGGSLGARRASVSFGRLLRGGAEILVSGSAARTNGAGELFFSEYGDAAGGGIARDLDQDESNTLFGSVALGRLRILGSASHRFKRVPTASFGTVFGDARNNTTDQRAFVAAEYEDSLGRGWSATARLAYDYYGYVGTYPFDYGEPEPVVWVDDTESHSVSSEVTLRRRFARRHLFTGGADVRRQLHSHQRAWDATGVLLDVNPPETNVGAYVQDEVRVRDGLIVNAGVRMDHRSGFGAHVTPRAGLLVLPRQQTALKFLYGHAFRAPNQYELYYYAPAQSAELEPEELRSVEAVWEEYVSARVRSTLTAFAYRADGLTAQRVGDEGLDDLYFVNAQRVEGAGLEAALELRLPRRVSALFSQTYTRTREDGASLPVSNSPRHLAKLGLQIPLSQYWIGIDAQYVGRRFTLDGRSLPGFFLPNVTLTSPGLRGLELSLSVYNATDTAYADPGAEEHIQRAIAQDGRTVVARARYRF
jgi:iron complex outermembrane receptor protein